MNGIDNKNGFDLSRDGIKPSGKLPLLGMDPTQLYRIGNRPDLRPESAPRFDINKIWPLFTDREARFVKKAIAKKNEGAVLTHIIACLHRTGKPFAEFMSVKRERIVV